MEIRRIRPSFTRPSSWHRSEPPAGSRDEADLGQERAAAGRVRHALLVASRPATDPRCADTASTPQSPLRHEVPQERTNEIDTDLPAEAGDDAEAAVEDAAGLGPGSGVLVVKRGPNAGSRFPMNKAVLTAGRNPDCDIFLDDITVSRRHAEFTCANGEFRVADLGSLNRTYLNRERIDSAALVNGDVIQIGKVRLVFLTSA